jgi:hypothetical protein
VEKPAGAFSFLARLVMSCHAVFSWVLVNDNLSFGMDIEDDFAVISLERLLAPATERLARNATAATVKNDLIFMGDRPSESNHPCRRNSRFVENVPLSVPR